MRFIFLIIIANFFIGLDAHHHCCDPCPKNHCCKNVVCPSLLPSGDLSHPEDLKAAQIQVINRLWNTPYPKLSCNGKKLKSAILKLADTDVDHWRTIALTCSIAFWSVAPYYKSNINYCSYSKSINATVLSETTPSCDLIFSALDGLGEMVADRVKLQTSNGVKASGCGCIKAKPMAPNCYKNGTVFMGNELWDLYGCDYPCFFEKAVRKLLKSCEPVDKLLAVMATASISKPTYRFLINCDPKVVMEMFYLQTMPKIDCCCCADFTAAIKAAEAKGVATALEAVQLTKLEYPDCCPN